MSKILWNGLEEDIKVCLKGMDHDHTFILTDQHTTHACLPRLLQMEELHSAGLIVIPAGDENKKLESVSIVWNYLCEHEATRKSLLINLGGGMVTDLGGFAAATFKRGIRFINIPTTLLSIVDAAVGGKTGFNFHGLKNEIGAFAPAEAVIIDSQFIRTLDQENFLSGYAEMIKHSLLDSEKEWKNILNFDLENICYEGLQDLLVASVHIKERIVEQDPTEKGIRKALNLGHTVGHAFESYAMQTKKPIPHGYAVAWGLVCELYLSSVIRQFDRQKLLSSVQLIKETYGVFYFDCNQYETLYEFMTHDKKNESSSEINFTLLEDIGKIHINQIVSKSDIFESFDFYREYFGC